jgi:hypothetical protein
MEKKVASNRDNTNAVHEDQTSWGIGCTIGVQLVYIDIYHLTRLFDRATGTRMNIETLWGTKICGKAEVLCVEVQREDVSAQVQ